MVPDKDKVLDLAATLEALTLPDVESEAAGAMLIDEGKRWMTGIIGSRREGVERTIPDFRQ